MKKMIARYLAMLILLMGYSRRAGGQERINNPCSVLQQSVNTTVFRTFFDVCTDRSSDVLIVDSIGFFSDCSFSSVCNRNLVLKRTSGKSDTPTQDVVTLYRADRDKNIYTLYFFRKYTGATVKLFLRQRKNKVKLIKAEWGAF